MDEKTVRIPPDAIEDLAQHIHADLRAQEQAIDPTTWQNYEAARALLLSTPDIEAQIAQLQKELDALSH